MICTEELDIGVEIQLISFLLKTRLPLFIYSIVQKQNTLHIRPYYIIICR